MLYMDQNQLQSQTADTPAQAQTQVQPQPVSPQPAVQKSQSEVENVQVQTAPVSHSKEAEAGLTSASEEIIKLSEVEPQLHPEVQEAGVEVVSDLPKLTEEHEKLGVKLSKESAPAKTEPTGEVKLPMTQTQAKNLAKNSSISDSVRWLAEEVLRQIKVMHQKLRSN